jgi:hypothetical protein
MTGFGAVESITLLWQHIMENTTTIHLNSQFLTSVVHTFSLAVWFAVATPSNP